MKKSVCFGNRKSICGVEIFPWEKNIQSFKSMKSLSKSVKKIKVDKLQNFKDWESIQTIDTPKTKSSKSKKYSFFPIIDQFKRTSKSRVRTQKTTNYPQVIKVTDRVPYKFSKTLQKRKRTAKTIDVSIDIELNRLQDLTRNCSKLLNDLSTIQQKKLISQYQHAIKNASETKTIVA